jgi:signal transduction histidine kinase
VLPHEDAQAGVAIDVAEAETARDELDRQIAAYDRTLDRVATAVAIFNRDQRLTFFNEAYAALWQLDTDWLETGPADSEILDRLRERGRLPEVVNYREWKGKQLERYKAPSEVEDWWHLPGGRVLHIISEQRPDGGVTYLYQDETERLSLESRYNAMIDVQRETLDSLKEGVAVFATDGRLKLFNSSFAAIWRLSRRMLAETPHIDEIISQAIVLYEDPRTWDRLKRAVTSFSDSREPLEGQMIRPDGSVIDFAATPLPDGATLITFADVTASKRYERALLERNEALIAGDRLKNQFISHVSYELRTPLTNIIGFSELLSSPRVGALNLKQREYLGDITSSSKTLLAIIDDILDLTTIDAGALELKLGRIAVKSVIEAAVLGVKDRAARARLTLDITVAHDADTFVGDEARVRQVLYNLLSNAVGFSRPGGTVQLACWRETETIMFKIEDQGVGIPKDQIRRVFERFESHSQGSKHRGAGLGLSIVKSLVELHGGTMTLDSEEGRGTRVTVGFPIGGLTHLNVLSGAVPGNGAQSAAG